VNEDDEGAGIVIERKAEIVREYGPYPGAENVAGVTFDGENVWFAAKGRLQSFDPNTGDAKRAHAVPADAGTAFDGRYLYQLAAESIHKVDPKSGNIVATIPAPKGGHLAGLAWAEGSLWVAQHDNRKIHRVDPETGRVLHTVETTRCVTGVTWVDGDLWHGTWENEESDIRRVDPKSGEVLERLAMPDGKIVTGLEADGEDLFFCGGGTSGKVRAVRRPKR
jgi:streptogramin lyase